jgi:hypothetical protein
MGRSRGRIDCHARRLNFGRRLAKICSSEPSTTYDLKRTSVALRSPALSGPRLCFAAQATAVQEDTILSSQLQVERKMFTFTLKENPRGRFLRITEDVGGRRDTVIIPSTGLEEFPARASRDGRGG